MADVKKNVVCIEDEPEMIDLIKLILGRRGFEFTGAMGDVKDWRLSGASNPTWYCST